MQDQLQILSRWQNFMTHVFAETLGMHDFTYLMPTAADHMLSWCVAAAVNLKWYSNSFIYATYKTSQVSAVVARASVTWIK